MSLRNLTIGKKIYFGFGLTLFLLVALGLLSLQGTKDLVIKAEDVIAGNILDGELAQREVDHLVWKGQVGDLLNDASVNTLNAQTDPTKCAFGKFLYGEKRKSAEQLVPVLEPLFTQIETPHNILHASAIEIMEVYNPANLDLPLELLQLKLSHLNWAKRIRDALLLEENSLEGVQKDPTKCSLAKWLNSEGFATVFSNAGQEFKQLIDALPESHDELHKTALHIDELLKMEDAALRAEATDYFYDETMPLLDTTIETLVGLADLAEDELSGFYAAQEIFTEKTTPALKQVQRLLTEIRQVAKENIVTDTTMLGSAEKSEKNVTVTMLIALAIGIFFAIVIPRGIVATLRKTLFRLERESQEVSGASNRISTSSQTLADGASQQSASLEETSASMEEISAMTRQNADNSNQADSLMKTTLAGIKTADTSMEEMKTSMDEITAASEETSKIVKTIDEIAFQTNLLALNAAVEAARAGEAGAGFAVVADEVRNLAMRAADAAKNTSNLIEGTLVKVGSGAKIVSEAIESFKQVADNSSKVGSLVSEIAVASKEQSQGFNQINTAITLMDSLTQQNSVVADESAAASEDLNIQAEKMKEIISDLKYLVDGVQTNHSEADTSIEPIRHVKKKTTQPQTLKSLPSAPQKTQKEESPDEIIPMDDESEFEDF